MTMSVSPSPSYPPQHWTQYLDIADHIFSFLSPEDFAFLIPEKSIDFARPKTAKKPLENERKGEVATSSIQRVSTQHPAAHYSLYKIICRREFQWISHVLNALTNGDIKLKNAPDNEYSIDAPTDVIEKLRKRELTNFSQIHNLQRDTLNLLASRCENHYGRWDDSKRISMEDPTLAQTFDSPLFKLICVRKRFIKAIETSIEMDSLESKNLRIEPRIEPSDSIHRFDRSIKILSGLAKLGRTKESPIIIIQMVSILKDCHDRLFKASTLNYGRREECLVEIDSLMYTLMASLSSDIQNEYNTKYPWWINRVERLKQSRKLVAIRLLDQNRFFSNPPVFFNFSARQISVACLIAIIALVLLFKKISPILGATYLAPFLAITAIAVGCLSWILIMLACKAIYISWINKKIRPLDKVLYGAE